VTQTKLLFFAQWISILAFVASLFALTTIPTSILLPGNIPYAKRLDEVAHTGALPSALGGARIERASMYGCIVVHPPGAPVGEPLCNRHLDCHDDEAEPRLTTYLEVVELHEPDAFAALVSSECDSSCCDFRATSFTGRGRRLDDDLRHRVWLRLGYLGAVLVGIGTASLAWARRPRASVWWRFAGIALFLVSAAHLWLNE